MIAQTPWVERKFNFDFPPGLYPCLWERLQGTPARLEEMLNGIEEEILLKKINNAWSIKEQVGHLADLDVLHDGRLDDLIAGKKILRAADMTNEQTRTANHNAKPIESLLAEFRGLRMNFAERLKGADEELISRTALHPRLQIPMRMIDVVYFTCEHDDHHIAKIRWILNHKQVF
jgi:hypothetical protein